VSPYVKRCIESFTSDWVIIHRKYKGRISPIARDRLLQDTPRQDFEVFSDGDKINLFVISKNESNLSQLGRSRRCKWLCISKRGR